MLQMVVPTYYGALSLQAFMGMKNKYQEEKYQWIEKYIHTIAYLIPAALCSVVAATENFNPNGAGCALTKAPRGCEADPFVECTRGEGEFCSCMQ